MASTGDRIKYWSNRWDEGSIGFHKDEVHPMLIKYFDKLFPSGKTGRVFVPLCGKTLDMRWLAGKDISVVGLDAVRMSLEQFFSDQNLQYTEEKAPQLAENGALLKSSDNKIHLYLGDMLNFSPDVEGTFEAVWDRASLVALNREDVSKYVSIIKSLLKPGGRCLLEVMDYDVSIMEDLGDLSTRPPPPHPMYEAELKQLYEPEFTVQYLDRCERLLAGKDIHLQVFLLTKQ
ncbi:probable thiopurine S-methyltransferase isoform X2 [Aplysia californica]|nr:probable thiopurine S-methyltransferase isoform X2 [Aplysia californica]